MLNHLQASLKDHWRAANATRASSPERGTGILPMKSEIIGWKPMPHCRRCMLASSALSVVFFSHASTPKAFGSVRWRALQPFNASTLQPFNASTL
jgi:hypothetical protein